MKRRRFITSAAGAGAAVSLSGTASAAAQAAKVTDSSGKLAGYTLDELHRLYHYDLFDDFLPFHDKYVIDHQYGGYMVTVDRDGTRISDEKAARYLGRGIWTYSFLYNRLDKNPKHMEELKRTVAFTLKNKPEGAALWPEVYSREGKPIKGPTNRVYEDLFIANGLAEFAKAAGDDTYWNIAKDLLVKSMKIYDSPDYPPAGTDFFTGVEGISVPGPRIQGHWMCLLDQATTMLEYKSDSFVQEIADRALDAIMNRHFNPEYRLNDEVINHDLSRVDNKLAHYIDFGHNTETAWMVMYEAARRRDRRLFDTAAERLRRFFEVAWDEVYGGLFHTLKNVDDNVWETFKAQYLQGEMLVGLLFVIEHTGAQWAKEYFSRLYTYVRAKFPLKQYGFPLWIDYADRKVTFERHASRAENFHHPRHLMRNLLVIERMIRRDGKISESFS
ncbi:MAG: AGE family epimerase/isomerase [Candidatus Latescibacter sp.]|nr:AGE family epimerase/isomerase [Candidatus Latescibacter sp.]